MDEKSQVIRSLLPWFGVRQKPLRGVAEIVLGHPLGGRDSLAMAGIAQRQARGAAQEAVKRQTTEDASLQAEKGARKATEGRPRSNANAKELAERAETDLVQERARSQELEKQLSIRQNDLKLVAQERARNQELEKQLAARANEQDLLGQERARSQELEKQLSIRQSGLKLVAQERARNQELEKQLTARANEQDLLAQERARHQELEKQLSIRQNDLKLVAQERVRNQELEKQLAARANEQDLLARERARSQELEKQLSIRQNDQKLSTSGYPRRSGSRAEDRPRHHCPSASRLGNTDPRSWSRRVCSCSLSPAPPAMRSSTLIPPTLSSRRLRRRPLRLQSSQLHPLPLKSARVPQKRPAAGKLKLNARPRNSVLPIEGSRRRGKTKCGTGGSGSSADVSRSAKTTGGTLIAGLRRRSHRRRIWSAHAPNDPGMADQERQHLDRLLYGGAEERAP